MKNSFIYKMKNRLMSKMKKKIKYNKIISLINNRKIKNKNNIKIIIIKFQCNKYNKFQFNIKLLNIIINKSKLIK